MSGASISGGKITAGVGSNAWSDWEGDHDPEEEELVVTISGIDLTGYSKLYISSTAAYSNHYGDAYCNVGIDTPHTQRFFTVPNGQGSGVYTTTDITLDVSNYTGVHSLQFYLYAYSRSSYTGYHSSASLGITEIKLIV